MNTKKIAKRFTLINDSIKTLDNEFYSDIEDEMDGMVNRFIDWRAWAEIKQQVDEFVCDEFGDLPQRDEIFTDLMDEIIADWKAQIHKKIDLVIKK